MHIRRNEKFKQIATIDESGLINVWEMEEIEVAGAGKRSRINLVMQNNRKKRNVSPETNSAPPPPAKLLPPVKPTQPAELPKLAAKQMPPPPLLPTKPPLPPQKSPQHAWLLL